jgi:hypothetical protein
VHIDINTAAAGCAALTLLPLGNLGWTASHATCLSSLQKIKLLLM